ncbi:type I restriction endonuclease subunit R [Selenomonas ruminantium]|uniref:Type I restriction enzyme endonuclease subunit n=1 Tax=Selenomonas ruminantium TaxID=971 RepID=A0A1H3WD06_SELRU|nr:type I restriction endonuclease subunit R [Selenomonas ruminantium]SDZ84711.1 type I restriction enzyme, R subunit [Selenomonas ruminantium]
MKNFISEDDIEQAILTKLRKPSFDYDIIQCDADPAKRDDLHDGTGRTSKSQCVLPEVMEQAIFRLNPNIDAENLNKVIRELCQDYSSKDIVTANYELYRKIRNGIKVNIKRNGKTDFDFVKLVDFRQPENNIFTAVSQMWIRGKVYYRRPDVLIFINGMPMVFIELKNSIVKVKEAYNDNLTNYKKDIPNLFAFNQICVLSNGLETRLGAFCATYEYFFEWLKVDSEKEKVDRDALRKVFQAADSSIRYFIEGLLDKRHLIDYIENFILFQNGAHKIIAKNHQYLGVNNLVEALKNRQSLQGKLGVFWHTQGSGKSFSMVMFVRKVRKTIEGNFTFLVVTDRDDLDKQIVKNFVRTEVIGKNEECQPKTGKQLREYLTGNKPIIFTMIHKFKYDKGKKYPVLSERNDIIVIVDEAHRTQYKNLAENMHTGLPNANYVAFTGTPLLGSKRLTNQWFGNYVSEYNFAQSVEDGSTVPLFYSKPVPEVCLQNDFLDDDLVSIIEEENLNEEEQRLLENSSSRILEVIKRDDRLDKIAAHIAYHFPRRGFLGKGMVVSVDKYTAVVMYEKVQHYWAEEKKKLTQERNKAATKERREELTRIIDYMNKTEMAVVISEEAGEEEKFKAKNLDIQKHRDKMNYISPEGEDIEDRFKRPDSNLQLVFVCAMWLTGFDVPSMSTLYLDKPMKAHTLMQAIARANRTFPGKQFGMIVDYVNVFKFMRKALRDYAVGDDGDEFPVKNMDELLKYLDAAIAEAKEFLLGLDVDIDNILKESAVLDQLEALREAYNIIVDKDEHKEKFNVIVNTLINLYESAKPEIFKYDWPHTEEYSALCYLHGLFHNLIDDEKINRARMKMAALLDNSVLATKPIQGVQEDFAIYKTKVIDLSKIDAEELKAEFKQAQYRAVEIDDMKAFIEKALRQMLKRNCTRRKFSERYRNIIDQYNAGSADNERYYEELVNLLKAMQEEDSRASREGLMDEELEIFDLLTADKKLTQAEEQKVKLSAKRLFEKLREKKQDIFVVDWYKDAQSRYRVKSNIEEILDEDLPDSYDKNLFAMKTDLLMAHFTDMAVQRYGWVVV